MKKITKALALLLSVVLLVCSIPFHVFAADSEMKIHIPYLGNKAADSVLVESNGEYLLMDAGDKVSYDYLISYLDAQGITHFSIYLSHFHGDHTGGLSSEDSSNVGKLMQKYTIDKVYLPDPSLLKYKGDQVEQWADSYYTKIKQFYTTNQSGDYDSIVSYLKKGDSFTLGCVKVDIIGPVGMDKFTSPYKKGVVDEDLLDDYQNNCSLVAKLTCGNVSYLTAGDCKEDGEKALIKAYKNTKILDSTIYKMSHHGMPPANTPEFVDAVKPDYSFATNYGKTDVVQYGSSKKYHYYVAPAQDTCSAYGFVYLCGQEAKSLVIDVVNNTVSLYRGNEAKKLNSAGWCKACGGDGKYRSYDYYYFDSNGKTVKGIKKLDGKYYNLGTGGRRICGYGAGKSYDGWVFYGKNYADKQYYYEGTDVMATGFTKLGDNCYYFQASDGFMLRSTKEKTWQKFKVGKYYYAAYSSGKLKINGFQTIDGTTCYYGKDGKMYTGWKTVDGKKYYFDKTTGDRLTGLQKMGDSYYYFNDYGQLYYSKTFYLGGKKLTANSKGQLSGLPKPKATSISSAKGAAKSVKLKWKKSSNADGYEIYYSTSKNGTYKLAKTITKASTTSVTIKSLGSKKNYYFKVTSYCKIDKYKIYSADSKVKSAKTK